MPKPYVLQKEQELRIEVREGHSLTLKLVKGQAEVFGTDLLEQQIYTLRGQKLAVFSWEGCEVQLQGVGEPVEDAIEVIYESDDTPMREYANVHNLLQTRREAALASKFEGPRTMVVGQVDVGKSTLCKILLNYAIRRDCAPTMIDLDLGQGSIAPPACIGATPVEGPIDVEEGLPVEMPLVYFSGNVSPEPNPHLYRHHVERMAALLDKRAQSNAEVGAAGMVINSMGWIDGLGYELILHSLKTFRVDIILVIGQDKLYSQLSSVFRSDRRMNVIKLTRSGGVVMRPREYRKSSREQRIREYFYGPRNDLQPSSSTVPFTNLKVYRVGSGFAAPQSALPIGGQSYSNPLKVTQMLNMNDLLHMIVAVSHAQQPEELLSANVAGFVWISNVDPVQQTVTYLAPCAGELPAPFLLAGTLKTYFR
ncbi:hypothetical protein WJX84_004995 [Apatococcus fuscideae]|uniref:Protein CLP1 homolog n=1 Tax=Apatococcus fuscideae TaxID=2026836 RepID=A0AAW1S8G3_9CHLO